jgi:hypothetical protein
MTLFDLDRAIWHVVPHFFEDECGERLKYRTSLGGRCIALMRAGEHIFYEQPELPDGVVETLRQAYNDLKEHAHFVFEEDDHESLLEES